MTTPITAIPGIGRTTEKILNESGYSSLDDIVNATVEKLSEVHGFGPVRADRIISLARRIIEQDAVLQPHGETDDSPAEAPPKKKDKKKKGKKKDKKRDRKEKKDKSKDKKKKGKKAKKNKKKKNPTEK
jgi:NAD-dependent DNA ligase